MPGDLLFGYISSGGKFIQPFTEGKDFSSSGVTLWRILLSFSILVFIPCSVYMAARKTQPELKKYLWMVYTSLAFILISAFHDYLVDAKFFLSPVTLPYFLFLYLIVLYIVQLDAYLADYSEKREKYLRNEQFIYTLNQANVIVVFLNRMGHVDYINPYFLKLTGYDIREVKGKDWFEFFLPPKDYYEVQSAFIEILEFDFHPRYSNPVISKDGREIPVDWYNVRLRDDSGNIYGSLSIGIDRPPAR
jgi:PAS domain S-box-containing protein